MRNSQKVPLRYLFLIDSVILRINAQQCYSKIAHQNTEDFVYPILIYYLRIRLGMIWRLVNVSFRRFYLYLFYQAPPQQSASVSRMPCLIVRIRSSLF